MNHKTQTRKDRQGGQAIVMVTLALVSMCGMMGLAVDVGWSYFVRRAERVAADSAALGAARAALVNGSCTAGSGSGCSLATAGQAWSAASAGLECPVTDAYLKIGCTYAGSNGFTDGTNSVKVFMASGGFGGATGTPPSLQASTAFNGGKCSGAACTLQAYYYVTATVQQTVPQLFSAVVGNPTSTVAVRATAAILNSVEPAQLDLINRQNDTSPSVGGGTNLCIGGKIGSGNVCSAGGNGGGQSPSVTVPGGISMASQDPNVAGYDNKGGVVTSPWTHVLGTGGWSGGGTWNSAPTNGFSDGPTFNDPFRGKGQLPISTVGSAQTGPDTISGGNYPTSISGGNDAQHPRILPPGNYYVDNCGGGNCAATTGKPLQLSCANPKTSVGCYYQFQSPSDPNCSPCSPNTASSAVTGAPTTFGDYVIYGGLYIAPGAVVSFGPGRYVFAGTTPSANCYQGNCPYILADNDNNGVTVLMDGTTAPNVTATNAGEAFIFTDLSYPGLNPPAAVSGNKPLFAYGTSGICEDSSVCDDNINGNPNVYVNLHGLNVTDPHIATNLNQNNFNEPILMWQDQQNSHVGYTLDGHIDTSSCTGATLENPCTNSKVSATSTTPEMDFPLGSTGTFKGPTGASTKVEIDLAGAIYQPRGAWLNLLMKGGQQGDPLQVVNGAVAVEGNGNLILSGLTNLVVSYTAALVE